MSENTFKVWITKYALTQGILEKVAENASVEGLINIVDNRYETYINEGKDWHKTKESAIKRAEKMRLKKIANVEKQLQKLKEMKFE